MEFLIKITASMMIMQCSSLSSTEEEFTSDMGLYLQGNIFTPVGVKALFATIFDDASLNAITESNHMCTLGVFEISHPIQHLLYELDGTLNHKRNLLIALREKE